MHTGREGRLSCPPRAARVSGGRGRRVVDDGPGQSLVATVALSLCLVVVGCFRETIPIAREEGPTVDARPYSEGLCSFRCARLQECNELQIELAACQDDCVEDALATLFDDPCWVETMELRRCVARKMSCDAITADELPDEPGTPCDDWLDNLEACDW